VASCPDAEPGGGWYSFKKLPRCVEARHIRLLRPKKGSGHRLGTMTGAET
jgi:hypothetical protein